MDSISVASTAQRHSKLEKQREILLKKRRQKHAHEVLSLQAKSINASVVSNSVSPRQMVKSPRRDATEKGAENFGKFSSYKIMAF